MHLSSVSCFCVRKVEFHNMLDWQLLFLTLGGGIELALKRKLVRLFSLRLCVLYLALYFGLFINVLECCQVELEKLTYIFQRYVAQTVTLFEFFGQRVQAVRRFLLHVLWDMLLE